MENCGCAAYRFPFRFREAGQTAFRGSVCTTLEGMQVEVQHCNDDLQPLVRSLYRKTYIDYGAFFLTIQ